MQLEYGHLLCRWSSYWLRSSKPGIVRCSCTFYWELDQYPDSETGNNLSGEIPASLANLTDLHLIDLSFNNLSGKVPIFPAQVFNIEGNPYLYTKGTDMVDKGSLPNSSKAKLNKSGIFYVITILMVPYYYSHLWDSSFFI
ncbi:protein NSP-INTERACTING KINASE 1 isoform X2 [Gossypium raimondii]|uniref:protein NSP-INTERACTING KINASE 1 isoform X2 n=1 Tax=Gossypium raimondii TaxID=29730 RepID=UPI00227B5927|nr:protein NSP-INTERACTING KINASE 1 isoform X2 [Gossypium raimondii]